MLRWLRRRQGARRLAQADAEALIRDHGAAAYREDSGARVRLTDGATSRRPSASYMAWREVHGRSG
jgi:hypothetical protein